MGSSPGKPPVLGITAVTVESWDRSWILGMGPQDGLPGVGALAGSLRLSGADWSDHRAGHDGRHLGVGTSPWLVMTLRTEWWCSQGLGSNTAIWVLGSLLSPPATLQGASGFEGLPRWLSSKESACWCKRHRFNPWVRNIPWRRAWQPTPIFLPRESHGQRSLAGYSSRGRKELDTIDCACTHTHTQDWREESKGRWGGLKIRRETEKEEDSRGNRERGQRGERKGYG